MDLIFIMSVVSSRWKFPISLGLLRSNQSSVPQQLSEKIKIVVNYSGDLNSELVWYSDHEDLFARRIVRYLNARNHFTRHLNSEPLE